MDIVVEVYEILHNLGKEKSKPLFEKYHQTINQFIEQNKIKITSSDCIQNAITSSILISRKKERLQLNDISVLNREFTILVGIYLDYRHLSKDYLKKLIQLNIENKKIVSKQIKLYLTEIPDLSSEEAKKAANEIRKIADDVYSFDFYIKTLTAVSPYPFLFIWRLKRLLEHYKESYHLSIELVVDILNNIFISLNILDLEADNSSESHGKKSTNDLSDKLKRKISRMDYLEFIKFASLMPKVHRIILEN